MNKVYDVKKISIAWLFEVNDDFDGIKNIIGIKVKYKGRDLFYSILDDCFFVVYKRAVKNELFVEIYEMDEDEKEPTHYTEKLRNMSQITKDEIIDNPNIFDGHFSDLDSPDRLIRETYVDFENEKDYLPNIIRNEKQYVLKKKRPIAFPENYKNVF